MRNIPKILYELGRRSIFPIRTKDGFTLTGRTSILDTKRKGMIRARRQEIIDYLDRFPRWNTVPPKSTPLRADKPDSGHINEISGCIVVQSNDVMLWLYKRADIYYAEHESSDQYDHEAAAIADLYEWQSTKEPA